MLENITHTQHTRNLRWPLRILQHSTDSKRKDAMAHYFHSGHHTQQCDQVVCSGASDIRSCCSHSTVMHVCAFELVATMGPGLCARAFLLMPSAYARSQFCQARAVRAIRGALRETVRPQVSAHAHSSPHHVCAHAATFAPELYGEPCYEGPCGDMWQDVSPDSLAAHHANGGAKACAPCQWHKCSGARANTVGRRG